MEILYVLFPFLELLTLKRGCVTRRRQVGQAFHLQELCSSVAVETTGTKVFKLWHIQLLQQVICHNIDGLRLRLYRIKTLSLHPKDLLVGERVQREQVLNAVH